MSLILPSSGKKRFVYIIPAAVEQNRSEESGLTRQLTQALPTTLNQNASV